MLTVRRAAMYLALIFPIALGGCASKSSPTAPGNGASADSEPDKPDLCARHVRMAIVTSVEARHSPLEDLLMVEATQAGGIDFLERTDLARVMAEQKLNASALASPEAAIRLGQILSADALVLLETQRDGEATATRMKVVESRSGVRLLDRPLSPKMDDVERKGLVAALRQCATKLRSPEEQRWYVAAVGFRSEESVAVLANDARILGVLVEQELAALPNVVMLERSETGKLSAEQAIAGHLTKVRSAAVIVEGALRRDVDGRHLIVTLVAMLPGEKEKKTASLRIARNDLIAGRKPVIDALLTLVEKQGRSAQPPPPAREADLLADRAISLHAHGDMLEATALYEAAFVLDPSPKRFEQGMACYREMRGGQRQCDVLRMNLRANQFANRYMDWAQRCGEAVPIGTAALIYNRPAFAHLDHDRSIDWIDHRSERPQEFFMGREGTCGIEPGADPAEVIGLGREVYELQKSKWERILAMRRQSGMRTDDLYLLRLAMVYYSATPEEARDEFIAALAAIEQQAKEGHPVEIAALPSPVGGRVPCDRTYAMLRAIYGMAGVRWDPKRLVPLWDWMTQHSDPEVHLCGLFGRGHINNDAAGEVARAELFAALSSNSWRLDDDVREFIVREIKNHITNDKGHAWDAIAAPARQPGPRKAGPAAGFAPRSIASPISPAAQPSNFIGPFIEFVQPDTWNGWSNYEFRPVAPAELADASLRIMHIAIDDSTGGAPDDSAVYLLCDRSGKPAADDVRSMQANQERPYEIARLRLQDGKLSVVEKFSMKVPSHDASLTGGSGAFYVKLAGGGIAAVQRGKVTYFSEADGLPVQSPTVLQWLDDRLYVAGPGVLARYAPAAHRFELLASSRSIAPHSGLDGGGLWNVNSIVPDTKQHCLWIGIDGHKDSWNSPNESRYGIWRYSPADGELRRVVPGSCVGLVWCEDRVLFYLERGKQFFRGSEQFQFLDPRSGQTEILPQNNGLLLNLGFGSRVWTVCHGDIFLLGWHLITEQGYHFERPATYGEHAGAPQDFLLRTGPGVLACNTGKKELVYFTRRAAVPEPSVPKVPQQPPAAPLKQTTVDLGATALELVVLPAGEFWMGSPRSDESRYEREMPWHRVHFNRSFYMGKYPITQEQWQAVMGTNPSSVRAPKHPVESVSWDDCQQFLATLNGKFAAGKGRFQLPSEAQWEYACRAGSTTRYFFGNHPFPMEEHAWNSRDQVQQVQDVGGKKANTWGLFDMVGNVRQWCDDWYAPDYYAKSPTDDPAGPTAGEDRVIRGSDWRADGTQNASPRRFHAKPGARFTTVGLRVCLIPAGDP